MSPVIQGETSEQFNKRMDIERVALGDMIRAGDYRRATTIAHYIIRELLRRAELLEAVKR